MIIITFSQTFVNNGKEFLPFFLLKGNGTFENIFEKKNLNVIIIMYNINYINIGYIRMLREIIRPTEKHIEIRNPEEYMDKKFKS
jgi:hypothetical protein